MENKKYKLPKKFATKWIEALRSGDYRQTTIGLCHDNKFCCLGVACMIAGANKSDISVDGTTIFNYKNGYLGVEMKISDKPFYKKIPKVLKGVASTNELIGKLVELNDDKDKSFAEIADWIENNVEFV